MTRISRALAAALIGVLVATGGAMAVARGTSDIGSLLVLCTGKGTVVVSLGPDGTPKGPAHLCPDAVLTLMAALDLPESGPERIAAAARLMLEPGAVRGVGRGPVAPQARGPPAGTV